MAATATAPPVVGRGEAPASLDGLGQLASPAAYMARNSRSFRFAAALMHSAERERVARVYAWCRFTDDIVDGAAGRAADDGRLASSALDRWLAASLHAYEGRGCGVALVDRVMGEMAAAGVPFAYAADLVAGVRSDLRFTPFADAGALRAYTYRVAGTVGRWLTELHGVHDRWMLERAAGLGHAMQVTNILRDVGEDWDRGRVYLPLDLLARHGLEAGDVGRMRRGEIPVDDRWRALVEELMALADRDYAAAREAIVHLPGTFRRSVAVAAAVYAGIHDAIRRNDYDNLRRRAVTSAAGKVALAAGALWQVSRQRAATRGETASALALSDDGEMV